MPDHRQAIEHIPVGFKALAYAKRLMQPRAPGERAWDLYEAAAAVGVRPRDLDLALWNELGGWA